jgi:hypothetical protein
MYAQGIAEPVHLWFLSGPEDLAVIGLLLLEHRVFEVDFFPDFGRGEGTRYVAGNDIVIGRGRGVFVERCNSTSKCNNLDYGRGREAYNRREVSTKEAHLECNPDLLWGIRSHPRRRDDGVRDHVR